MGLKVRRASCDRFVGEGADAGFSLPARMDHGLNARTMVWREGHVLKLGHLVLLFHQRVDDSEGHGGPAGALGPQQLPSECEVPLGFTTSMFCF